MINTKLSFLHRVGNIIQGIISIVETLVMILTFSYFLPNWTMKFIFWRMDTKLYGNPKKE